MRLIRREEWEPEGVDSLEPAALRVVKNRNSNSIVRAGPGAGKTELLAQRATFLLKTGVCPYPKRILAISFKKDAAKNLKERVKLRCGDELSLRFDSFTFDAFAKSILDRFKNALPQRLRPTDNYLINFEIGKANTMSDLLDQIALTYDERRTIHHQSFEKNHLTKHKLPIEERDTNLKAANLLWDHLLHHHDSESHLNFSMINRLVEFILRSNPKILKALQKTYSFVFLDEFQDTTSAQYELTKTCFLNSDALLTAVGDDKQKIMGWAGALDNIFNQFEIDFNATPLSLIRNYRSARELVLIQHSIMRFLEGENFIPTQPMDNADDGQCRALLFNNCTNEAQYISTFIHNLLENDLNPREICILTRNQPEKYTNKLINKLNELDINARIESELQDLLSEPIILYCVDILKLIIRVQSVEEWSNILDLLIDIQGEDTIELRNSITSFITEKKEIFNITFNTKEDFSIQFISIVDFLIENCILIKFPQYAQGNNLVRIVESTISHIFNFYNQNNDLESAIESFEGINSIPIMTMHKSKGLEFHTVIFMGLEDSALWNFSNNQIEETNGFFVAFSRAKKRMIFTASHNRYLNGSMRQQSNQEILPLYDILRRGNIEIENL